MNILIVGTRSPYTLELIRHFSKSEHTLFGADFFYGALGNSSRYLEKSFVLSSPNKSFDKFRKNVFDVIESFNIELIIPCNEEVFHFAKLKKEIGVKLFAPNIEDLTSLHDKFSFIKNLEGKWSCLPQTFLGRSEVNHLSEVILKPRFSRFGCYVQSLSAKELSMKKLDDSMVIQQKIYGQELSVYSVVVRGRVCAHSIYLKKYSINSGATIFFKHSEIEEINIFLEVFFRESSLTGQFSFDFIFNKDGYFPIECNPRGTSGIHLFNHELYKAFFGERIRPISKPKAIFFAMPVYGFKVAGFIKDLMQARDVVWNLHDPLPFLTQFSSLTYFVYKALRYRVSLTAAMTLDIEYNG